MTEPLGRESLGTGTALVALLATALAVGSPAFGAPELGAVHRLFSGDAPVKDPPSFGTPSASVTGHFLYSGGLTVGSPSIPSPDVHQKHVTVAQTLAIGGPTIGSPDSVVFSVFVAANLTIGRPVFGLGFERQTHVLTASAVTDHSPYLGTPELHIRRALYASSLSVGSPVFGAAYIVQMFRTQSLTVSGPEFSLETRPRVWFADAATQNYRGEPIKVSIFTNHNDKLNLDLSGKALVGNSRVTRGQAENIYLFSPLVIDNQRIYLDVDAEWWGNPGLSITSMLAAMAQEVADRENAIDALRDDLQAQIDQLVALTNDLQDQITALASGTTGSVASLQDQVNAEVVARTAADTAINNTLTTHGSRLDNHKSILNNYRGVFSIAWITNTAMWPSSYGWTDPNYPSAIYTWPPSVAT